MGKVPCWAPELRLPTQEWEDGEALSLGSQQAFLEAFGTQGRHRIFPQNVAS